MNINIYEAIDRPTPLLQRLLALWEASVRATHAFLSELEIQQIKGYVPQALSSVPHLIVAEEAPGAPAAFLGIDGDRLEMLFLSPAARGKGLGKRLLQYGVSHYGVRELTVNEQNPQAVSFYQHMGFVAYRRTALDEEGQPYPLLYMKLDETRQA